MRELRQEARGRGSFRRRRTRVPRPEAAGCTLLLACALLGCAPRTVARTLGQGNGEARFSAGGPFLGISGAPVPIPSFRVGGRVGATDTLDVDGSLALDPFVFGVLALDAGLVQQLLRVDDGFALSISTHAHFVFDLDDDFTTRAFPEVGLHAAGPLTAWLELYGGLTGVGSIDPPEGRPPVFLTPYLGLEANVNPTDATRHLFSLQLGWTSPWEDFGGFTSWEPNGFGALFIAAGWRVVVEDRPAGAFP